MSESDRIFKYQTLFGSRRAVPMSDIMRALEISKATAKRDIAKLRDQLGTPIVFDKELGGYRLDTTQDATQLPGFWFSQDEILALLTIHHMIEQLDPGVLGSKLKPLRERLNKMLTQKGLDLQQLTERVRAVHAGKRALPLAQFETLARGTLERRQVQIVHTNRQKGESVTRTISPQQLVHYRDNWYVDAWCHLRKDVRSFSVDAISSSSLLDKAAKDIDLLAMRKKLVGGYGIFGGTPTAWAELLFSAARAEWVRHESWHPQQQSTLHPDGSYTLRLPYADDRELIGDILRFGADVQVIGPESLRQRMREQIERMRTSYR